jgi:hypothetical protein
MSERLSYPELATVEPKAAVLLMFTHLEGLSVAMKKSPLVAKWWSPLVAR